jgi:hypothetical protein
MNGLGQHLKQLRPLGVDGQLVEQEGAVGHVLVGRVLIAIELRVEKFANITSLQKNPFLFLQYTQLKYILTAINGFTYR